MNRFVVESLTIAVVLTGSVLAHAQETKAPATATDEQPAAGGAARIGAVGPNGSGASI